MATTIKQFNLKDGQRAERKLLVAVAEWEEPQNGTTGTEKVREILGRRTPDSSIEYNIDQEDTTDILGNNYTDVNKTQPTQAFDPFPILGGSRLGAFLNDIRRRNALSELTGAFTIYIINLFMGDEESGYEAEKQDECTITYDSIGGDTFLNFAITVHYSNKITTGKVDKFADDFVFTPDVEI